MRLERLTYNKIKIFLTFDDLQERGIDKEELWHDVPKVHGLFRDLMSEAKDELDFRIDGPLAVEVFALPAQGMVIIITKGQEESDELYDDDFIEMKVTLDKSDEIFFEFRSFEHVISLAHRLLTVEIDGGALFAYENHFYLKFEDDEIEDDKRDQLIALLAEFGNTSTLTSYRVLEHGKELMKWNAVQTINTYFNKNS